MLDDIAAIDIAALLWLLAVWGSYNLIMDRLLSRRVGLNQYMKGVRRDWMLRMMDRENRITDAALVGKAAHQPIDQRQRGERYRNGNRDVRCQRGQDRPGVGGTAECPYRLRRVDAKQHEARCC